MSATAPPIPRRPAARQRARSGPQPWQIGLLALLVIALLLYPVFDRSPQSTVTLGNLADTGVFILLALGLNIVIGYAGLLDLGYAAFFAIGSYTFALLASGQIKTTFQIGTFIGPTGIHLPFWLLLIIAPTVAALFGVLLGAPTLRLRGDYLAIVTLGFGEIVPVFLRNAEGITGGANGIPGVDSPVLGLPGSNVGFTFGLNPMPYYYMVLIMVLLAVPVINRMRDSRVGRAWMALREDELAAAAMGIDTTRTKLLAFAMGAAFSGFAGSIYAPKLGLVSDEPFRFENSVFILCMIILGGLGNIWGVIVGAASLYLLQTYVLTNLPTWLREFGEDNAIEFFAKTNFAGLRFLLYGIALVVMMIVRPEGLLPNARRKAELHPETATIARRESEQELYDVRGTDQQESDTRGGGKSS